MLVFGYVFCSSSISSIWVKSRWKTLSYVHSGVWQCMHHTQLKWSTAKTRICNKNSVTFWIVTHQPIEQAMRYDDPRKQCSDALIWLFHLALLSLNTFLSFCRWNGRMSVLMRPERESALRTHTHTSRFYVFNHAEMEKRVCGYVSSVAHCYFRYCHFHATVGWKGYCFFVRL